MNFWGAVVDISGHIIWTLNFLGLIGGAAYLIDQRGWSPWWMLPALFIVCSLQIKTETK